MQSHAMSWEFGNKQEVKIPTFRTFFSLCEKRKKVIIVQGYKCMQQTHPASCSYCGHVLNGGSCPS
jgi:hypothetical protein